MKKLFLILMVLLLPIVALASPLLDSLETSGSIEASITAEGKQADVTSQGVMKFEAVAESGKWFVGGEAHIRILSQGEVGELEDSELFFKFGNQLWDLEIGKVLPNQGYNAGQDLSLLDDIFYTVDYIEDFKKGGVNLNYKSPNLRIQLHAKDSGVRPWVHWNLWDIAKLKLAYEYVQFPDEENPEVPIKKLGYSANLSSGIGPLKIGVSYAAGKYEEMVEESIGGWANLKFWKGVIGVGLHQSSQNLTKRQDSFVSYVFDNFIVDNSKVGFGYVFSQTGEEKDGQFRVKFKYTF